MTPAAQSSGKGGEPGQTAGALLRVTRSRAPIDLQPADLQPDELQPMSLSNDRLDWDRLTEECSSALSLLGGPAWVGVTSCMRGDGRTTIATAMALAQGHRYRRTILFEADIEKPSLVGTLGLRPGPGVAELLRGEAQLRDCIRWTSNALGVVTAGNVGSEPARLHSRLLTLDLVARLRELCDGLIVDLPPFLGPGVGLARSCPTVVLVIRAGITPIDRVERVGSELDHPAAILNHVDDPRPRWMRGIPRVRR
jgi:Mrp family chromosome partitioning ATPase